MKSLFLSCIAAGMFAVCACSVTMTSGPAASAAPVASASPTPLKTAPPDEDDAKFRTCATDIDCVAVERVGCCHNGRMVAVAATSRDAYAASFTCDKARPICPEYRISDTRVPYCDAASHACSMKLP